MDKFLWAVRIFKTRTIAADACAKGQVTISGLTVKPSRHVAIGEILMVRKPPMVHTYKVLGLLNNRLSAEKVKEFIEEITPDEEFHKVEMIRLQRNSIRDKGTGRPTKKERRDIDRFTGNSD
jgi:Ribosome-associated heat shock protein implicated in the recycling of the 50S subunit (S4 paralog)